MLWLTFRAVTSLTSAQKFSRRLRAMQFPIEYHAEIPKQYGEQQAAGSLFWWLALAAAAGILVLLLTVLGSWRLAALVFVLLPVALAGGIIAAWLTGGFGSLYVLVALAAVLAFAVRDAVMLMGTYQSLQQQVPTERLRRVLMKHAASERLQPTVLSAVITGLALAAAGPARRVCRLWHAAAAGADRVGRPDHVGPAHPVCPAGPLPPLWSGRQHGLGKLIGD